MDKLCEGNNDTAVGLEMHAVNLISTQLHGGDVWNMMARFQCYGINVVSSFLQILQNHSNYTPDAKMLQIQFWLEIRLRHDLE